MNRKFRELTKETMLLQGERIKSVRHILGLTQRSFGCWLFDLDNFRTEPYKEATIAAWENGRRRIPERVMDIISKNISVNGCNVQMEYLLGDSKYMLDTEDLQRYRDIDKRSFKER